MKILLVADVSIHKVIGGAERVLFEQCTRLSRSGHGVHILTRRLPEHDRDREVIGRVQEWRYVVETANAPAFIRSALRNGGDLFESLQREFRFDCIVFHQPLSAFAVLRSAVSRALPKVYVCHSLAFEEYESRNPDEGGLIQLAIRFGNVRARKYIERLALRASDPIIVLSRFTQDKLWEKHHIPPGQVRIVPGGVDLDRFSPAVNRNEIRNRLRLPPEKIILFTVRNLVPRMGLENLIRAMGDVAAHFPEVCLVIGGKGPLRESLAALAAESGIAESVRFAGFIPEDELPDYYRMADLFILPTRELEGFGLVTVEALACGTPVLGTPVGGTVEILKDLNPDLLFRDTEPASMAEGIVRTCMQLKADSRYGEKLSARCRSFAEERYSWERNVAVLETILSKAVAKGGV